MKVFLGASSEAVGSVLKEYRKAHNMTQQKVADFLGLDRTTYCKYETFRKPEIDIILKLSELYQISLDEFMMPFFGNTDAKSNAVTVNAPKKEELVRVSEDEKRLLLLYRGSIRKTDIMENAEEIFSKDNSISDKE